MNRRLARMRLLKRVLASISAGRGVSASIVLALRQGEGAEQLAARKVLLGFPPGKSMALVVSDESRELGMLASLVTMASGSNVAAIGKKGTELSNLLERWLKAGEERAMEARVFQMRGLIMSAVLGALMATVSTMGPLVASSNFLLGGAVSAAPSLTLVSGAMVAVSSSMLGIFLSGRRFYVNLALSVGVYLVASFATSPLGSVTGSNLWGIK
jgi:hypothetical protein